MSGKRREQRGYVFHRGGSWFVRYCDDVMVNGVVQRKLICKQLPVPYCAEYRSKASVRSFVRDILAPVNAGTMNPQATMTLESFVDGPYFEWAERNLRACTISGYRQMWDTNLKPRIGKVTLRNFRTVDGERLLVELSKAGLGRRTLQHNKAFLSGAFTQAIRFGILDTQNPMTNVSIPRVAEPDETHAYGLAELNVMLLALADKQQARTMVMLAALTGLRKSEIRGLRWQDFTGNALTVQRGIVDGVTNETKTAKSKAPVPVVKTLADALHTLRKSMGETATPDSSIFQSSKGTPISLDYVARTVITPALEGTKVQWCGWHGFRRGCATMLHAMGIDDRTVQAILRHSNITLTQNVYIKSLSESQVTAMDTLEKALQATIEKTNQQNDVTCNNLATPQPQFVN